jgi:hypothetical protein
VCSDVLAVSFIVSLSTSASTHKKPASTGTSWYSLQAGKGKERWKFVPVYSMKAYRRRTAMILPVLNLVQDVGQWSALAAFPQGKKPLYPVNGSLHGSFSLFRRFGDKKNVLPVPGTEPRIV